MTITLEKRSTCEDRIVKVPWGDTPNVETVKMCYQAYPGLSVVCKKCQQHCCNYRAGSAYTTLFRTAAKKLVWVPRFHLSRHPSAERLLRRSMAHLETLTAILSPLRVDQHEYEDMFGMGWSVVSGMGSSARILPYLRIVICSWAEQMGEGIRQRENPILETLVIAYLHFMTRKFYRNVAIYIIDPIETLSPTPNQGTLMLSVDRAKELFEKYDLQAAKNGSHQPVWSSRVDGTI